MFLKLHFLNDQHIAIRIFTDHKVHFKWFNFFNSKKQSYECKKDFASLEEYYIHESQIIQSWKFIQFALSELERFGLKFPTTIPTEFNYDQNILNELHRFFVYNALFARDTLHLNKSVENVYNSKFTIPEFIDYNQWFSLINLINDSVHLLEKITITDNKNYALTKYPFTSFDITPTDRYLQFDNWLEFDQEDFLANYDYEKYSVYQYLVLLDQSILGKSVLRSFYDEDNPNEFDCTGRLGSNGGITIDIDYTRKRLYASKRFQSWCKSYERLPSNLPLELPLGTILDPPSNIHELFVSHINKEIRIEFCLNL